MSVQLSRFLVLSRKLGLVYKYLYKETVKSIIYFLLYLVYYIYFVLVFSWLWNQFSIFIIYDQLDSSKKLGLVCKCLYKETVKSIIYFLLYLVYYIYLIMVLNWLWNRFSIFIIYDQLDPLSLFFRTLSHLNFPRLYFVA